jgi:methionine aminopeptidase
LTPLEEAFTEIVFSANVARMLTSPNDQSITLPSLALMDDAEVKTLCETMRKPEGGEQGTNVATRAEVSLNTVCYMGCNYRRTSRVMVPGDLTFDNVVIFSNHRKSEVDYKEPLEKLKLVKV